MRDHRCRLYLVRVGDKEILGEVWDTLDHPHPESDLPKGTLVASFQAFAEGNVRRQVDEFLGRWQLSNEGGHRPKP
jgi:hypothetical protein